MISPCRAEPRPGRVVRGQQAIRSSSWDRTSTVARAAASCACSRPGVAAVDLLVRHPDALACRWPGSTWTACSRPRSPRSRVAGAAASTTASRRLRIGRRSDRARRSVSLRPGHHRLRPASVRRGHAAQVHDRLGAHPTTLGGVAGVHFAVWAPNAQRVSVIGDFNGWDGRAHPMRRLVPSGVWELFVPGLCRWRALQVRGPDEQPGTCCTRSILTADSSRCRRARRRSSAAPRLRVGRRRVDGGARPCAARGWIARWAPTRFTSARGAASPKTANRPLTYRELAEQLVPYVRDMGFTHIELLPVLEHPFGGSWGYQVTRLLRADQPPRHPHDFKYFVDACHQAGIGVLLDWVPGHFPEGRTRPGALRRHGALRARRPAAGRAPGLGHADLQLRPQRSAQLPAGERPLLAARSITSTACASMRSRRCSIWTTRAQAGQWVPNRYGGRENLEAVSLLQQLNTLTHAEAPGTITVAEESTSWPGVSRPVHLGGLGFTYKWNMGWMHDTLKYTERDPVHRRWAQNEITFSMLYAFTENFILPYSHDEVVHGKRSMLDKMPGDAWQKAATCARSTRSCTRIPARSCCSWAASSASGASGTARPASTGRCSTQPLHAGLQQLVRDLNHIYAAEPALYERDYDLRRLLMDRLQRPREQRHRVSAAGADGPTARRRRGQLDAARPRRLPRRRAGGRRTGAR